jgi:hypothetical protein
MGNTGKNSADRMNAATSKNLRVLLKSVLAVG